jgi:hypothetical protein
MFALQMVYALTLGRFQYHPLYVSFMTMVALDMGAKLNQRLYRLERMHLPELCALRDAEADADERIRRAN